MSRRGPAIGSAYRGCAGGESDEHPVDATVTRRLPQRKLGRRIRELSDRVLSALGDRRDLWIDLEELMNRRHAEREEAYFDLGHELGVVAGRSEGHRALDDRCSPSAHRLADHVRAIAVHTDVSPAERVTALLEAAWALAQDLVPDDPKHPRRKR